MKSILVVCPQPKDNEELERLKKGNEVVIYPQFDGSVFEKILIGIKKELPAEYHPDRYLAHIHDLCDQYNVDTLFNTCDYPGSFFTSIIAQERGLKAPSLQSVFACHHKYYSRLMQEQYVPEATPQFALVKKGELDQVKTMQFPLFLKPVKSYLSALAKKINTYDELVAYLERVSIPEQFLIPFNWALQKYADYEHDGSYFIAEELLQGRQVTLEGFVHEGEIEVVGIVDSYMLSETLSFDRFVYPSDLPENVQHRMIEIAQRCMSGLGFNHNLFNIEFMYNPEKDTIHIIEINPRISIQFSDLFEIVNGVSSYEILYNLMRGNKPIIKKESTFSMAASLVCRKWDDHLITRAPTQEEVRAAQQRFPELRFYPWMDQGSKLSDVIQDGVSYVYCWIHLGAQNKRELEEKYEEAKRLLPYEFKPI